MTNWLQPNISITLQTDNPDILITGSNQVSTFLVDGIMQSCTQTHTRFLFNWPIFPESLQVMLSSVYSCTDANTTKLLSTWQTTVHHFLTSFSTSICVRPAVTNSLYHATGSACMTVGRFLLLARLSGTHCPKTFGIRSVVLTVTDTRWRHFYFCSTSMFSTFRGFIWMRYTNLHLTWHLTFMLPQAGLGWSPKVNSWEMLWQNFYRPESRCPSLLPNQQHQSTKGILQLQL